MIGKVYALIDEIGLEYAPDPRSSVFEVDVYRSEAALVLEGGTSVPEAAEALHARVAALELGVDIEDRVLRFPPPDADFAAHGIVRAAVAPMLAGPLISDAHLSQVLLGHRVLVLREYGRWLQCRSVDGYIGWIHRGYVQRMTETEVRSWEVGAHGEMHFSLGAEVVDADEEVAARLPWGCRVAIHDGSALLPDGFCGAIRGALVPMSELATRFPTDGRAMVETARLWRGAPYLWGGVTPAGVDCSGLVQAVCRAHGIEMPRDSDQQVLVGEKIDPGSEFRELAAGDLLFFAEEGDRISHVAISAGGSRVIHSALGNGGVQPNDLRGESGYERELRSLLRAVRRVIPPPAS